MRKRWLVGLLLLLGIMLTMVSVALAGTSDQPESMQPRSADGCPPGPKPTMY